MPLIKSISGIRGTIGGLSGESLSPNDILNFIFAYAWQIKNKFSNIKNPQVILGRDGRKSGPLLHEFIRSSLCLNGINVLDVDLATTPTIAMAVINHEAQGGIIISASHNPRDWNALKLLNENGEFLNSLDGKELYKYANKVDKSYPKIDNLGLVRYYQFALDDHINNILKLKLVNKELIKRKNYKIVVDAINSVGALAIPKLLESLGIRNYEIINSEINGEFAHNPEPLEKNLKHLKSEVRKSEADLGIAVDPDVDRLAFVDEKGQMFGEEYTLVAVADYVLSNYSSCFYQKTTVSNLSSSRALKDLTEKKGGSYYSAKVGEVNVVEKMKKVAAVIGGEGNGGVIYPELHYGRDALVGIALFLGFLAQKNISISELKKQYPKYEMIKDKIELGEKINLNKILKAVKKQYNQEEITDIDGVKINWPDSWLHLRASKTEPIIRVYAEAKNKRKAQERIKEIKDFLAYFKQ